MTGNNSVCKTIWKNGNKEYNEKQTCYFFTISNLKSAIMYKCRRVVLLRTSVYFAISKLILSFSYSFHVPCIILPNIFFTLYVPCFPFSLINHNQSVVNQMSYLFFLKLKNIFLLSSTF